MSVTHIHVARPRKRAATDLHPKVSAGARVAGAVAAGFTILSAVGVVVPNELQDSVTTIAVDVALFIPLAAAYVKAAR